LDDTTGKVRVIIAIDPAHPPLTGDQATVVRGLLGSDAHIDLVPGPEAAPPAPKLNAAPGQARLQFVADPVADPPPPRKPLPPGTEIPAGTNANAAALAAQAGPLIPQTQRTLAVMEKTMRDYDRLAAPLNNAIREYTELAAATRGLIPQIQQTNEEMRNLVRAVNATVPRLNQTNDEFQATARSWNQLGQRLDSLVALNQNKLTEAVDNLNTSLVRIASTFNEENQQNLAATLQNTRAGSERLDSITRTTETVLNNLQQASQPFAARSATIVRNLDEGSARYNASMTSLQSLLQGFSKPSGTLGLLLNDTTLYNNLNAAACMIDRTLPQVDRLIRDLDVFADKIARHPESLGLGGVLHPSGGLKQSPFDSSSFRSPH
jgi:ABC-type transporter Mla subunit MlaD